MLALGSKPGSVSVTVQADSTGTPRSLKEVSTMTAMFSLGMLYIFLFIYNNCTI